MKTKHENRPSEIPAGIDVRMEAPVSCEFTYYAKNEDGRVVSTKIRFPFGQIPTQAEIAQQVAECRDSLSGAEGYAELTKPEFWRHITIKKAGELLPMPGSLDWEKRQ